MAKAKKLPSGNWRIQIYCGKDKDGKRIMKSFTAPTKTAAQAKAEKYLRDNSPGVSGTFKACASGYLEAKSDVLSPSTIYNYRKLLNGHLSYFNEMDIAEMNHDVMQRFTNDLSKKVAPKTVRNIVNLAITIVKYYDPDRHYHITYPQKKQYQYNIPTDDTVKAMLAAASDHETKSAILLASIGTLRRGEVCALEYEDIDGTIVHVHRDMVQRAANTDDNWVIKEVPKTSSSDRYIDFPEIAIKEILDTDNPTGRIVTCTPNALGSRFRTVCNRVGIKCRFHDLRHYAASIMHAIGVPDQYIMARGGWKNDTTLKSVYRNTLADKENAFASKTNEYLGNTLFE